MIGRTFIRASLLLVALGLTAGAHAQRRPDMVLNKPVGTVDQARASRRALTLGVQCLLQQRPSNVRSFLQMYPDSRNGVRAAEYLNAGDCVDGQAGSQAMRFGPTMLRGVIYKAMYQRDFAKAEPELRASVDFAGDAKGQPDASASGYVAARTFGECVVRRDPATVRALVLAEVETEAEMDALRKLVPAYDACFVKGQDRMTRGALTGVFAEVLYRLSKPESGKNA